MNVSLFQAASAMNANSRWQEIIAENLAASSVPGYRKQQMSLAAVSAGMMPAGSVSGSGQFVVPQVKTSTNFQPGELKFTGNANDVAIEGKGFFEVQLPTGGTAFTRDGEFQLNAQGQLVTKEGYAVMGQGGAIYLDRKNPAPLSISASGDLAQGADKKGKLKLVEFDKPEALKQVNGSYFTADDGNAKPQPSTSTVRQFYLEGSNTSTVSEMANLLTASRTFETNQRLVQMHDDRMGRVISDLGNPS